MLQLLGVLFPLHKCIVLQPFWQLSSTVPIALLAWVNVPSGKFAFGLYTTHTWILTLWFQNSTLQPPESWYLTALQSSGKLKSHRLLVSPEFRNLASGLHQVQEYRNRNVESQDSGVHGKPKADWLVGTLTHQKPVIIVWVASSSWKQLSK